MWTTSANNNRQQQNSTEARNGGNMASLKNKITHRKRKSAKNQQPTPAQPEKLSENNKATESSPTCNSYNKSKVPSSDSLPRKANGVTRKNSTTDAKCKKTTTGNNSFKGNNGSMRRSKNEPVPSGPDLIRDLNQPKLTTDAVGSDVTDCAAVHAHDLQKPRYTDPDANKRYSDSFVINRQALHNTTQPLPMEKGLSRAHSELSIDGAGSDMKSDKSGRKSRRFSDIFRYGVLRPATSCDNLKLAMKSSSGDGCFKCPDELADVVLRKKDAKNMFNSNRRESAPNVAVDNKHSESKSNKVESKKGGKEKEEESYLKRVKSRIYKNRNDNSNTTVISTMPDIAEHTTSSSKKSKKKKGQQSKEKEEGAVFKEPEVKKSSSHFEFRLIRQTSNLERIRPRTFGLKPASTDSKDEKPVLAKSKSSSAINLSLLRVRRNKLLEQAKKNCKLVHNEFDFIAFGGLNSSFGLRKCNSIDKVATTLDGLVEERRILEKFAVETSKPGHPVSRTGSDRRPDAVREESSRTQDGQEQQDRTESEPVHQDSTVSLPAYPGNKKRSSANINRSESVKEQSEKRKQRRNISDPLHNTTHESVDLDQQGLSYHTNSGSSSNSSLSSNRSSESPSTSLDAVSGFPSSHPSGWDSDMEVEADPPDWHSSVSEEELARLHPHEKKRQDVINELFHTERSHVRNLRVLDYIFRKPLQSHKILKQDDVNLVFPSLGELLEVHTHFNNAMKSKRKEGPIVGDIGDLLVNMFDGPMGDSFQLSAALFCERQQLALEFIKEKRKKDSRFENFLSECEKNNLCRRLPLQGILPTEMQRLSKYPLLLERLIDSVEKTKERDPELAQAELGKLRQSHDRSKEILNHVNEAAKIACNRARLEDIQRHLDTSYFERTDHAIVNEFKNLDLTRYNLIHEGMMHLRRQNKAPVPIHIVLLEEAVILLQRDAERYVLKFFQSGTPTQQALAPIIKTSTLLVRANAASKSSLFLFNTSSQNSQMYDLLARDSADRDAWFKHISDVAEAYNKKEGKSRKLEPAPDVEESSEVLQELPGTKEVTAERSEHGEASNDSEVSAVSNRSSDVGNRNSDLIEEDVDQQSGQTNGESPGSSHNDSGSGGGLLLKLTADDWPLVQPTEVHVAIPPVHTAEAVLTPIEQIRRKDEEVRKALADKEGLVADLLSIPREDYQLIADIAGEVDAKGCTERDPAELVLAAVYQADQLLAAVNESLNVSPDKAVIASGGKHPSCASNEALVCKQNNHVPSVPIYRLQEIATALSTQLTTLLSVVKERDEERDRLRKELQRTREQLHDKLNLHGMHTSEPDPKDPTQTGDLESIEESLVENDSH